MSYKVEAVLSAVDYGFAAQFDKATKSVEKLQKQASKVGDFSKNIGAGVEKIGSGLTKGLTLPLGAAFAAAGKKFADFEQGLVGVGKTTGLAGEDLKDFGNEISKMSSEIPASTTDLLQLAETAGQLGIHGKSDLLEFTKVMAEMGSATNLAGEEGAKSLARFANIMGLDVGKNVRQVGNAIVRLGNNFATSEGEIMEMSKRLAASGRLVGVTTPGVLALATAMSSVGINAEAGGTAMSTIMKKLGDYAVGNKGRIDELNKKLEGSGYTIEKLYDLIDRGGDNVSELLYGVANKIGMTKKELKSTVIAAAEGEMKLKKLAEVSGMSADKFSEAWRKDPMIAIQSFMKGLDDLQKSGGEMSQVLDELGIRGIRETNAVKSLAQNNELLADAIMQANDAYMYGNDLAEEAAQAWDTLSSKLKMLRSTLGNIAKDIFSTVAPTIKELVTKLNDLGRKWYKLSEETREAIGQMVLKVGALVAALGPALVVGGKVVQTFSPIIGVLSQVGNAFASFTSIVAPNMKGFGTAVNAGVTIANVAMKSLFSASVVGIAIAGLGLLYSKFGEQIDKLIETAWFKGPEIIKKLGDGITSKLPDLIDYGAIMVSYLSNAIAANLKAIIQVGADILVSLAQGVANNMDSLINSALKIINTLIQGIANNLPRLLEAGIEVVSSFAESISKNSGKLIGSALELIGSLLEGIVHNLPRLAVAGMQVVLNLGDGIIDNLPKILEVATRVVLSFLSGVKENLPKLVSLGLQLLQNMIVGILDNLPRMMETTAKVVITFIQGINENLPQIISSGVEFTVAIVKGIIRNLPAILEAGAKIVKALATAILETLKILTGSLVSGVKTFFTSIFSPGKEKADETGKDINQTMDNLIADIDSKTSDMSLIMGKNIGIGKDDVLRNVGDMKVQTMGDILAMTGKTTQNVEDWTKTISGKSADMKTNVLSATGDISSDVAKKFSGIQNDMSSKYGRGVDDVKRSSSELSGKLPADVGKMSNATAREYENLSRNMTRSANNMDLEVSKSFNNITNNINASLSRINSNANSGLDKLGANFNRSFNSIANTVNQGVSRIIASINNMNSRLNSSFTQSFNRLTSMTRTMWNNFISVANNSLNRYYSTFNITLNKTNRIYIDHSSRVQSQAFSMWNGIISATNQGASRMANAFIQAGNSMRSASSNIASGVVDSFRGLENSMYTLGYNAGIGFNNGLAATQNTIYSMASGIANNVASRIQGALNIHSPSRVMMSLGSYAGEGLAIGLEKSKRYVNSAVDGLSDSIQGVNTGFNSSYRGFESNRQAIPIVLNLKMGRNEFRAMSRDITQEQGKDLRLEANFDI
ncbi:phage tail tape measure protein [Anaerococcus sp. NML200537]|uniref:phage tail tape measure protein n=1 Tax=Anaerococcus sp. NML200537 TaxID=2954485 RepID=UPI002238BB6D|nr:phage tail tape measure protein [Anaerococcus sp. NML200537]MCW6701519.1 phage tail tape measure protein [Anaerococcus sp. NML200537]